jgi:hypothetical protein
MSEVVFYFYKMLSTFNKWKIMSEVVFYFYKMLSTFNKWKIMSEVVFYFYKLLLLVEGGQHFVEVEYNL